jgi:hypothetical protein
MNKLKIILASALAVAGVAASLLVAHKNQVSLRARDALLRRQDQQLADLISEQQRLSNLVSRATAPKDDDHTAELLKLRAQAEALRKQTNELARQSEQRHRSSSSQPAAVADTHTPEYWEQLHKIMGAKGTDARNLSAAFREYASDHQGQAPRSLDDMAAYLAKPQWSLSGTNQFEIVYHGSLADLDGLPVGQVAVVREQQTWLTPDGKVAREYGMSGGIGQVVASDDNFQAWEAKHIIPPPDGGKSGR